MLESKWQEICGVFLTASSCYNQHNIGYCKLFVGLITLLILLSLLSGPLPNRKTKKYSCPCQKITPENHSSALSSVLVSPYAEIIRSAPTVSPSETLLFLEGIFNRKTTSAPLDSQHSRLHVLFTLLVQVYDITVTWACNKYDTISVMNINDTSLMFMIVLWLRCFGFGHVCTPVNWTILY